MHLSPLLPALDLGGCPDLEQHVNHVHKITQLEPTQKIGV